MAITIELKEISIVHVLSPICRTWTLCTHRSLKIDRLNKWCLSINSCHCLPATTITWMQIYAKNSVNCYGIQFDFDFVRKRTILECNARAHEISFINMLPILIAFRIILHIFTMYRNQFIIYRARKLREVVTFYVMILIHRYIPSLCFSNRSKSSIQLDKLLSDANDEKETLSSKI